MNPFEKIVERLSNIRRCVKTDEYAEWNRAIYKAEEIVQGVAKEYNNGWIPCSERLPDKAGYEVIATLENGYGQRRVTIIFTGYGDSQWHCNHKEFDLDVWKVIAWQPLPEPYQTKGE